MLITVFASGSKGNVTLIQINDKKILIDLGMNYKYLCESLSSYNLTPSDITHVLITHGHKDHVGALPVFIKKNNPIIYVTEGIIEEVECLSGYDNISLEDKSFNIDEDIRIETFNTSHDAKGSRGYIINYKDKDMVYVTDTGYINQRIIPKISNKQLYIFESNHDIEMLMHGRYPTWLKQRVASDVGHLSNGQAGTYLSKVIGDRTKKVILAHLSEENNTPEIALDTVKSYLKESDVSFKNLVCAKQFDNLEIKL
jgi:phosphoribosyl 1,2-cyclic phosphodiesterase